MQNQHGPVGVFVALLCTYMSGMAPSNAPFFFFFFLRAIFFSFFENQDSTTSRLSCPDLSQRRCGGGSRMKHFPFQRKQEKAEGARFRSPLPWNNKNRTLKGNGYASKKAARFCCRAATVTLHGAGARGRPCPTTVSEKPAVRPYGFSADFNPIAVASEQCAGGRLLRHHRTANVKARKPQIEQERK